MCQYLNVLRANTMAGLSRKTMALPVDVLSVKSPGPGDPVPGGVCYRKLWRQEDHGKTDDCNVRGQPS